MWSAGKFSLDEIKAVIVRAYSFVSQDLQLPWYFRFLL